jgi:L-alanine-DL-glutamate epimerase-like enolase superfamily enzyme
MNFGWRTLLQSRGKGSHRHRPARLGREKLQMPVQRLWGLSADKTITTSFTIGIDRPEIGAQRVREAEAYPILKITLGAEDDKEMIRTVRASTQKP